MGKLINAVFGVAIAIVLFLVAILGFSVFLPTPPYPYLDCVQYQSTIQLNDTSIANETFVILNQSPSSYPSGKYDPALMYPTPRSRACDLAFQQAQSDWEQVRKQNERIIFYVANIIALCLILGSIFTRTMPNIMAGLICAGIAIIIFAFSQGWDATSDKVRFAFAVILAIVVIVFAIKARSLSEKPMVKKASKKGKR